MTLEMHICHLVGRPDSRCAHERVHVLFRGHTRVGSTSNQADQVDSAELSLLVETFTGQEVRKDKNQQLFETGKQIQRSQAGKQVGEEHMATWQTSRKKTRIRGDRSKEDTRIRLQEQGEDVRPRTHDKDEDSLSNRRNDNTTIR